MSNLGPQQQNVSYDGLLQVDGGISSTLKPVQDGMGNMAGLWLSSTGTNALTATDFVASVDGTAITGALPRPISDGFGDYVSVKDFGATGDGVTDDTVAINTALAALSSGGCLFFPAGNYVIKRGNGALLTDNIPVGNVTICGEGAASHFITYNAAGAVPDNTGNQYYNVFQATGKNNICIKDLSFSGYCNPISVFSCTNILVDGIVDEGLLSNSSSWLRNMSVYSESCTNVKVVNSSFNNIAFSVYLGGTNVARTTGAIVSSNSFTQTATTFKFEFPVGVYIYYADDVIVSGCTFNSIYSSVSGGSTGTGMGYGVYEGDGACTKFIVTNCTFQYTAKGTKNAIGIYINQALDAVVSNNVFRSESAGRLTTGVLVDVKSTTGNRVVNGNAFTFLNTSPSSYGCYVSGSSTTNSGSIIIANNNCYGGLNGIRVDGLSSVSVDINGNIVSSTTGSGVQLTGGSTSAAIKFPKITNNKVTASGTNGISLNSYVISPVIIGNTLLDGNTSNAAGDLGAAIFFGSYSFGSIISNNIIGNTAFGGGLFTYGAQNVNNASNRIFKDITANNTFINIDNNSQFGRYFTTSPSNGIFDINKGDFIQNVQLDANESPGWYCVTYLSPILTADASSASTTITLNSTSGILAGDIILLTKTSNPYAGDYAINANWHVDTVASITDATHLVLTTGIPVGDGTYVAGTAAIKTARFKAAAAIAA